MRDWVPDWHRSRKRDDSVTKGACDREKKRTGGEPRFFLSSLCRPIPLSELAMQIKLAQKVYCERRSKENPEGRYEVIAPGSSILKVSPSTSTIKEPGKAIMTVSKSDFAKFDAQQERQTPLKVYADHREPRTSEKQVEA